MIEAPPTIICESPRAIDGDTIACSNLVPRIRLLGIDAPELPGHCRPGRRCTPGDGAAATRQLTAIIGTGSGTVHPAGFDRYGRIIARVTFGSVDASCAMLASGAAVQRYGRVSCAS
jgi:endonuclease YncB( thermonuclease family)